MHVCVTTYCPHYTNTHCMVMHCNTTGLMPYTVLARVPSRAKQPMHTRPHIHLTHPPHTFTPHLHPTPPLHTRSIGTAPPGWSHPALLREEGPHLTATPLSAGAEGHPPRAITSRESHTDWVLFRDGPAMANRPSRSNRHASLKPRTSLFFPGGGSWENTNLLDR